MLLRHFPILKSSPISCNSNLINDIDNNDMNNNFSLIRQRHYKNLLAILNAADRESQVESYFQPLPDDVCKVAIKDKMLSSFSTRVAKAAN